MGALWLPQASEIFVFFSDHIQMNQLDEVEQSLESTGTGSEGWVIISSWFNLTECHVRCPIPSIRFLQLYLTPEFDKTHKFSSRGNRKQSD